MITRLLSYPRYLLVIPVFGADDLKSKMLGVIVLILMVVFLGPVINWDTGWDILLLGASIGFVVVAVTYYLRATDRGHQ